MTITTATLKMLLENIAGKGWSEKGDSFYVVGNRMIAHKADDPFVTEIRFALDESHNMFDALDIKLIDKYGEIGKTTVKLCDIIDRAVQKEDAVRISKTNGETYRVRVTPGCQTVQDKFMITESHIAYIVSAILSIKDVYAAVGAWR